MPTTMMALKDILAPSKEPISIQLGIFRLSLVVDRPELQLEREVPFAPDVDALDEYRDYSLQVRMVFGGCLCLQAEALNGIVDVEHNAAEP